MMKHAKKLWLLLATMMISAVASVALAQQSDEPISKETRKEAKKMEKEGWKPLPLAKDIAEQLHQGDKLQKEKLADRMPRYFIATGKATAATLDVAKTLATERARQELAAQMNAEVSSLTDFYTTNLQGAGGEATSTATTVIETRVKALQRMGRTTTTMEVYRPGENDGLEVMVRIAFDKQEILKNE